MATTFSTILTASTSLILIDTSKFSKSIVLLSSINAPNSIFTIRDTKGYLGQTSSIIISTTRNISLAGSNPSSILLNTPYNFISLTPNTTSQWTILNTFNVSDQSAINTTTANISSATISTVFSRIVSTAQLITSSLGINCNAPRYPLDVNGPVNAQQYFLNGEPFEINGMYSTIKTSTINIGVPPDNAPSMTIGDTSFYTKKPAAGGVGANNIYLDTNGILMNDTLFIPPSQSFIGVNTSTPQTHLDVSGNIQANIFLQRNVSFPPTIDISTGSLYISSTTLFINGNPLIINTSNLDNVIVSSLLVTSTNTFGTFLNTSTLQRGLFSTLGNIDVGGSINVLRSLVLYNQAQPAVSTVLTASGTGSLLVNNAPFSVDLGQVSSLAISSMQFINNLNAPVTVTGNLYINAANTINRWVAVGSDSGNNVFKTSTDGGFTWVNATPLANGTQAFALAYNGRQWLTAVSDATPQGTTFYTSSNGTTWSQITATGNYPELAIYGITWTGSEWLVAGSSLLSDSYTVARSPNGIQWSSATGTAIAVQANGIAFDGRRTIVVGQAGLSTSNIRFSDNRGVTFQNASAGFTGQGFGIATNKRVWIAVGSDSTPNATIKYSLNGTSWTNSSGGFTTAGIAVAWNGILWVAVGQDSGGNTIKYSYDGIVWQNATGGFESGLGGTSISWSGTQWVATGYDSTANARIKVSQNGITWQNSSSGSHNTASFAASFSSNVIPDIQIDNLSFFGKSQFPSYTSTNIINITNSSLIFNNTLAVTQDGRVGVNSNTPSFTLDVNGILNASTFYQNGSLFTSGGQVASSINVSTIFPASTMSQVTTLGLIARAFSNNPYDLNINNTLVFTSSAITLPSTSVISANPSSLSIYTPTLLNIDGFFTAFNQHSSNIWVTVGRDTTNFVKFSLDGSTWQNTTGATFTGAQEGWTVVWNGLSWLTSLSDSSAQTTTFFTSQNGSSWSQITPSGTFPNNSVRSAIWTGQQYVVVGTSSGLSNTTIARSPDGITWTAATSGGFNPTNGGRAVAFDGRRLVAVGFFTGSSNETIQYSDTLGATWITIATNGFSTGGRGIATNGRIWVAVGTAATANQTIKYSLNGATGWTNIAANGFTTSGLSVAWNGTRFVATGQDTGGNTNIKYSDDGITWSNASSGLFSTSAEGLSVTWNGSLWVAGGSDSSSNARLKTSQNGLTWTNSASGAFSSYPNAIAFSSNVYPDFAADGLEFYGKNQPSLYTSTNKIFLQPSTININNSLLVSQPNPIASLTNPTIDMIGPVRARNTVFIQSTLGIVTTGPLAPLDITQPSGTFNYPVLRNSVASDANAKIFMSNFPGSNVTCWPVNSGTTLNFYYRDATSIYKAFITGATFFTGQHANVSVDPRLTQASLTSNVGLIVKSADQGYQSYKPDGSRITGKEAIWITEALPKIVLTDTDKDPAVWGVVTNHQNDSWTTSNTRELDTNPTFANSLRGRIRVNGLGEGAIWVTNSAGNIANGDYICSSTVPGHGRKQDDDCLHNYTVAKATMSCSFDLNSSSYTCEQIPNSPWRRAFIGCTYHCS